MQPNQIKDADILDILFEGRNKDYGAYELRKTYNRRITKAMMGTGMVIVALCLGWILSGMKTSHAAAFIPPTDVDLVKIKEPDKPMPIPPVVKVQTQPVAIRQFTAPIIVKTEVPPDEKPPMQDELEQVKIGTANAKGSADVGIDGPPSTGAVPGVTEAPKKNDDEPEIFTKVEIESNFPGGGQAWLRFLNKNLRFPDDAMNNGIEGSVMVQFIVDKDGNISDVQAVSGPEQGGLREEAVRVIKKSGKWIPAQQNGRYVKSYKRQPVGFKLMAE
jgi:periplasmic protein TonB